MKKQILPFFIKCAFIGTLLCLNTALTSSLAETNKEQELPAVVSGDRSTNPSPDEPKAKQSFWKKVSESKIKTTDLARLVALQKDFPDHLKPKDGQILQFVTITVEEFLRTENHTCSANDPRLRYQLVQSSTCYLQMNSSLSSDNSSAEKTTECVVKVDGEPQDEDPCL